MKSKCVVHTTHKPAHEDSRILKELSAISDINHYAVTLLDIGGRQSDSKPELLAGTVESYRIHNRLLEWEFFRSLNHFLMLMSCATLGTKALRELRPAVIHIHDAPMLLGAVIYKRCFDSNTKLIYDAHELESEKAGQTKLMSFVTKAIESWAWSSIDYLIVVAESIGEWYQKYIGEKPVFVIYNSPEESYEDSSAESVGEHRVPSSKAQGEIIEVCYVGKLADGRSLRDLLDIFESKSSVPCCNLHIYGYGPLEDEIQNIAKLNERIVFHGRLPHNEVTRTITRHDVGICAIENVSLSDYFAMPNKLFEYAFAGLYIVGSKFPEIERFIGSYGHGVAIEASREKLAASLEALSRSGVPSPQKENSTIDYLWCTQRKKLQLAYIDLLELGG